MPKTKDEEESTITIGEKLIDFSVLRIPHLRNGVIAQFFYNGGQTAINSLFLVYCCTYVGIPENTATTFFGFYMLAFLLGRWIGSMLMIKFKPANMLLVYSIINVLLCMVIIIFGGMVGLYAMIGVSFFMSIMYLLSSRLPFPGWATRPRVPLPFLSWPSSAMPCYLRLPLISCISILKYTRLPTSFRSSVLLSADCMVGAATK